MRAFWKRNDGLKEVERMLRRRPEPRSEYVEALEARVRAEPLRSPRAWSRAAFVSALATMMLGTFASFGGLGYAAAGAQETARTVTEIVTQKHVVVRTRSAAGDQYGQPAKPQVKAAVRKNTPSGGGVAGSSVARSQPSGALPFTGVSLGATALLGSMLLGLGIVLRRRERSRS